MKENDSRTTALGKDLKAVAASAAGRQGVLWTLEGSEDLNANLVRFGSGRGVGEHVKDEVDVVFVGVSGSGFIEVGGEERALGAGARSSSPRAPGDRPGPRRRTSPISPSTSGGGRYESALAKDPEPRNGNRTRRRSDGRGERETRERGRAEDGGSEKEAWNMGERRTSVIERIL